MPVRCGDSTSLRRVSLASADDFYSAWSKVISARLSKVKPARRYDFLGVNGRFVDASNMW